MNIRAGFRWLQDKVDGGAGATGVGELPADPLCASPQASREAYLDLHAQACALEFPQIDAIERCLGFAIDRQWMNSLALHTQVVIKKSRLNFQHGRLLYAVLRDYLSKAKTSGITIVETGTARGFSSLCMAKALDDAGRAGTVVTFDILPHDQPIYWNCIDDHEGKKSRRELLRPWQTLCEHIVFVRMDAATGLQRIAFPSVALAFLDASHTLEDVRREYLLLRDRQRAGDIIVFDDVTRELFPGVVEAIEQIENEGLYDVQRLPLDDQRGYAVAIRR